MLIKLGEATLISADDIQDTDTIMSDSDLKINDRMKKFAKELKKIAPQASDFLYFTAVMMHAAEAAILDDDGNVRKNADGSDVTSHWEKVAVDSVKWVCSDSNIRPYKNSNNDIFPESELKIAYPKWVGRPLCLDHKSSSVEHVRGVIVDTYWDDTKKRIIALCALDKVNYEPLARKVTSGYATNVSMGTAVGRAVCTEDGCHRVAKVESDFCDHMKSRTCYGEINLDLSPIELSLVVTGADPKAKVKHIIAKDLSETRKAASALQDYLDGKIALASTEDSEVNYIKEELAKLNQRVEKLAESLAETNTGESDVNDTAYGATRSSHDMKEAKIENEPRIAPESNNISYATHKMLEETKAKLASINDNLNKLSQSSLHNSEGSIMTKKNAYYQGTEEPTPGKPQYSVEPGQEARMQDKHMVGQKPFPGVGPVDGMHPGIESQQGSEADLKKRLLRQAEAKRREQIRREALSTAKQALEARGYHQGTEEPTPGKPQYPVDPLGDKARLEDKHLHGAKPFPEVGPIDGLYGDDLKTKEMISRAELRAAFKKGASKGESRWTVYAGEYKILTASVNEITKDNAEALYDTVASREFGKSMIKTVKAEGVDAAKARFKGAQDGMGATPGAAMGEGPATGGTPDMGGELGSELGGAEEIADVPEEKTIEVMLDEASKLIDDIKAKAVQGEDVISDEMSELGGIDGASADDEAKFASASVYSMRKTVSSMLGEGFKETIATLDAHSKEIEMAKDVCKNKFASFDPKNKLYFASLVDRAVADANKTAADTAQLMEAFVRYAHGTAALEKKANTNATIKSESPGSVNFEGARITGPLDGVEAPVVTDDSATQAVMPGDDKPDGNYAKDKKDDDKDSDKKDDDKDDKDDKDDDKKKGGPKKGVNPFEKDDDDKNNAAEGFDFGDLPQGSTMAVEPDGSMEIKASADLTTKEGRAMHRAKIAQKGIQFSDMLQKAHPKGGHTPESFEVKPSGDLSKVETLAETNKAMNDLANMPPKVRKQAQEIADLVSQGKIAAEDVDGLAAYSVDPEAIKYYKAYWGESKDAESNEFASRLVAEQAKAKTAALLESETVKIKRAHELAYEMRDKGMIDDGQINQQVSEIMKWNDDSFSSLKSIVAKTQSATIKNASVPQVGMLHSEELYLPAASAAPQGSAGQELTALLDARWSKKRL